MKDNVVPKRKFGLWLLRKRLAVNPAIIINPEEKRNILPGWRNNPDNIPAQNGTIILRKGISLFSTSCSNETL